MLNSTVPIILQSSFQHYETPISDSCRLFAPTKFTKTEKMVYESDFYTTRRPYRTSPSISSYTISGVPSRQVRVLPGLGKVHVTYTYDRIVPYVGHKRLTVVTAPPKVWGTRPSVLQREFDRIENKVRPWTGYSATNRYLNSDSAVRTYYVNYPITGSDYYTTVSSYSPKLYSSYYSWPREYYSLYRTYLTRYLRNYYLNTYLPSYYWSTYLPYIRNLDYDFSELENKIDNLRRTVYLDYPSPIKAIDYSYYPYSYKSYSPLSLHYDYYWPLSSLNRYSSYWPHYPYYRYLYHKYTLPSDRNYHFKRIFDDETRLIRAQTASLLKRIHDPVPRVQRYSWPLRITARHYDDGLPVRLSSNDNYIHRLLVTSPRSKTEYTTYYTEPVKKYIGDRVYSRRPHIYLYEDPLKSDIQLLSYYINRFRQDKAIAANNEPSKATLDPARPTRKFAASKLEENEDTAKEMKKLREARAARLAFINEEEKVKKSSTAVDDAVKAKNKQEEERLAEERALVEEQSRREAQAKKEEAERKAELARQEELAAQAAAERAAELERQAELTRQQEIAKQAQIEKARKAEEERIHQEEQRRLEEEERAAEVRKQQERLEELARQAEEERQAELARQAEELAELARQEAELAEEAKREAELAEIARQEEELAELARQEAELEELERKEKELAELAEQAREEAEAAQRESQEEDEDDYVPTKTTEEVETAEEDLERQQAELDALEAEAKALEAEQSEPEEEPVVEEEEEDEETRKQREMDELIQQKFELAELEKQQAELDALDAEARALADDVPDRTSPFDVADDDEEPAIAEDTPIQSDEDE